VRYSIHAWLQLELSAPVREHHIQLRLAPLADANQRVVDSRMTLVPEGFFTHHRDGFGNALDCCGIMAPHQRLSLRLQAEVETLLENPFDYALVPQRRERDWIRHALNEAPRLWDFVLHRSTRVPELETLGAALKWPGLRGDAPLMDQVQGAMGWIGEQLDLDLACPDASDTVEAVVARRCASAADMAHLLIAVVRAAGVPARLATGFVDPDFFAADPADPGSRSMPETPWAWAEVLIPGAGWRGFDPAAGLVVNDRYVRVAVGRDAGDVRRMKETFKGEAPACKASLTVRVRSEGGERDGARGDSDPVEEETAG